MFSSKNKKKAFTLIEMLIVIVIIGILAAAIIPKLSSARGRANDVARKADLAQVAAALVAYQIDHGRFPSCPGSVNYCILNAISGSLIQAGMSSIPTDPDKNRVVDPGIDGFDKPTAGEYIYTTITKGGIPNNGFVVMAATETEGGSNRDTDVGEIGGSNYDTYEKISAAMCKEFGSTPGCNNNTTDDLRYIYLY